VVFLAAKRIKEDKNERHDFVAGSGLGCDVFGRKKAQKAQKWRTWVGGFMDRVGLELRIFFNQRAGTTRWSESVLLPAARLRPMPNAQCPMPNAQCPVPSAQCPVPSAQCPVPGFWCCVFGVPTSYLTGARRRTCRRLGRWNDLNHLWTEFVLFGNLCL